MAKPRPLEAVHYYSQNVQSGDGRHYGVISPVLPPSTHAILDSREETGCKYRTKLIA